MHAQGIRGPRRGEGVSITRDPCAGCADRYTCGPYPCPRIGPEDIDEVALEATKEQSMEATNESRVRINLAQGAKGDVKFDITAEFPSVAESEKALGEAVDAARRVCAEKGLKLADAAA
jgi:hypothetical protein